MKVFLKNKGLVVATLFAICIYLIGIKQQFNGLTFNRSSPLFDLISFLFVISAFICNFHGKVQAAIVCAVAALVIRLVPSLSVYIYSAWDGIFRILYVFPQTTLLVFLFQSKRNIKTWAWLAWGAVYLPIISSWLYELLCWGFFLGGFLVSIATIPLGFVYCLGFINENNATYSRTVVPQSTAASYLEEYKRKRMNGGK